MSATETTEVQHHGHDDHGDEHHDHPSDRSYVGIAIFLAVLTAVEVLLFVIEDQIAEALGVGSVKIALVVLMIVKFWIVGAYFMHLKFDNNVLTKLFVSGLLLAVAVYFIMLSAFEFNFWNDGFCDTGLPGGDRPLGVAAEDCS